MHTHAHTDIFIEIINYKAFIRRISKNLDEIHKMEEKTKKNIVLTKTKKS